MRITIELETDNAAFEDYPDEVNTLIDRAVRRIKNGHDDGAIMDTNGNRVGSFSVEDRPSDVEDDQ